MDFELYLKYSQNGVSERNNDVCLGPQITSHSLHTALNWKRKISNSMAFISYTPCNFLVMCGRKEKRKKKKNKIDILG